jgi:hypothetical protein
MDVSDSNTDYSAERIANLASQLSGNLSEAIENITSINETTKVISLNAKIASAKAGEAGKRFSVVAEEILRLSQRTSEVATSLQERTGVAIGELERISQMLATNVLGQRLTIYASQNIDLIDRNLYERSCDVRWWATDTSLVEALADPKQDRLEFASKRMRVILSAYTVYYDLVLADVEGRVVANGRPDKYSSFGAMVGDQDWYRQAMASRSGDEYGLQSVHPSALVKNERVLIYSCAVREGGRCNGRILGVLGIVFKWDALAQTVVRQTPLDPEEWKRARVCIVDNFGLVIADSAEKQLREHLSFRDERELFGQGKGFKQMSVAGVPCSVARCASFGFETYRSGWHAFIVMAV